MGERMSTLYARSMSGRMLRAVIKGVAEDERAGHGNGDGKILYVSGVG